MRSVADMNSAQEAVAAEVRAALARKKIDQSKVAEVLSLSRSSVSQRINGHHPFSVAQLLVIAHLVDIEPAEFFRTISTASRAA